MGDQEQPGSHLLFFCVTVVFHLCFVYITNMNRNREYAKKWRRKVRGRYLAAFGGKCGICGYSKCSSALDLHHVIPEEKEFNISSYSCHVRWELVVLELRKCVCLCANCHREVEVGVTPIPSDIKRFDETFALWDRKQHKDGYYDKCPTCGGEKRNYLKYCSRPCAYTSMQKINWDEVPLKDFIEKGIPLTSIAKKIGVSDNAVKKRLEALGLPFLRNDREIKRAFYQKTPKQGHFKGVVFYKKRGLWVSKLYVPSKKGFVFIGSFKDPVLAAKAYDAYSEKHFGNVGITNKSLGLLPVDNTV